MMFLDILHTSRDCVAPGNGFTPKRQAAANGLSVRADWAEMSEKTAKRALLGATGSRAALCLALHLVCDRKRRADKNSHLFTARIGLRHLGTFAGAPVQQLC